MFSYIDDRFTVLDETLLSINDRSRSVLFPSEIGGHRIRRLGAGLFVGEKAEEIIISEGIEEIGSCAFNNGAVIKKLYLPESLKDVDINCFNMDSPEKLPGVFYLKRKLSREDYDFVLDHSILLSDGSTRILVPEHKDIDAFWNIYKGFGWYRVPRRISRDMKSLFLVAKPELSEEGFVPSEMIFMPESSVRNSAEDYYKDFRKLYLKVLLASEPCNVYAEESENRHDKEVQAYKQPKPTSVFITEFNENDVLEQEGAVHALFRITFGMVFFGKLVKVVYQGKDYFVYRENYLTPNNVEMDYTVVDYPEYIVDSAGNTPEPDILKAVAAKYRFSSMLN